MVKKRVIESVTSSDPLTRKWKATFATGRMAYEAGELREAGRLFALAVEMAGDLPEHSFAVPACEIAIAAVMLATGSVKEAESKLAKCLAKLEGTAAAEERELYAVALRFHAQALLENGNERKAEKELQQSIQLFEKLGTDGAVQLAYSLSDLSGVYLLQGRIPQAEEKITRAMAILGNALGPENPECVRADMIYCAISPMGAAARMETISDGIQRMEYAFGSKHPNVARALNRYLHALETRGEHDRLREAKERFARAMK